MRQVSSEVTNAILNPAGYLAGSRLTVYDSRIYFEESDLSLNWLKEHKAMPADLPVIPTDAPYNMAVSIVNRNDLPDTAESVLAIWSIGSTGLNTDSCLLFNGVPLEGIFPRGNSRVGCWNNGNAYDQCAVWYFTGTDWVRRVVTLTDTPDYNVFPSTIGDEVIYGSINNPGACYPVSYTEAVILDVYEGGIRVSYVDDSGATHTSPSRYMNPIKMLDADTNDVFVTHFAGAVKTSAGVFMYFTDYLGAVIGMKYQNGIWSDIFTSVPQDQSQFDIGNVFTVGERVFICGKFYREEQFASTNAYTLLVWSDDGITFTLNRRTLVTMVNNRWQAVYDPSLTKTEMHRIYFISPGPVYSVKSPYQLIGEQADNVVVDLVNLSGSAGGEFQAACRSGAEEYFNNEFINTGSYGKLELSQNTASGIEYVKYHDVVVTGISKGIKDGERKYTLMMQTNGIWHTSNMTHPMYMEMQGKQSYFDNFLDQGGMVHASVGTNPRWTLAVSFWTAENDAFIFQSHAADTATDHMTADLKRYFTDYPIFGDEATYDIRLFGWSRAGIANSNPAEDSTNPSTLNDDIYALYEVMNPATEVKEIKVALAEELKSDFTNFPQSHYLTRDGSIPVVFTIPNPGAGFKITRLGIRLISGSLGATTYCLERIEVPGISAEPLIGFTSDEIEYGTDGNGGKITNTRKAVPQILFTNRPYSAFNFDQTLRVEINGTYSVAGLVGLANDKYNFIVGSLKIGELYFSKYVSGVETVLATLGDSGIVAGTRYDLRFWHRNGLFGIEYKPASELIWPEKGSQLVYEWTAADGALAPSDDMFHLGTYSFIDPPRFRITGFKSSQSVLGVLPLDLDPGTNTSDFETEFPESGQIDIDNVVYSYAGKVSLLNNDTIRGPFQLRNTREWTGKYAVAVDGSFTFQGGPAIEFLMFDWNASVTKYAGCVIASNSGYAWINDQTDWVPWITTSGVKIILRNRSRHYGSQKPDWYDSGDERIYVTNGLIGIAPLAESEGEFTHSEGSWAYLHSDDKIVMYEYSASSGEHDQTVRSLLGVLNRIAGTTAEFPGDFEITASNTDAEIELQEGA